MSLEKKSLVRVLPPIPEESVVLPDRRPRLCQPFGPISLLSRWEPDEVTVRYGRKEFAKAIKDFPVRSIAIKRRYLPCGVRKMEVRRAVKRFRFDKRPEAHNVLHVIVMTHRMSFPDLLTAMAVGSRIRRIEHDIVTLFTETENGRLCHMVMRDCEGARELIIDYVPVDYLYDEKTLFLAL